MGLIHSAKQLNQMLSVCLSISDIYDSHTFNYILLSCPSEFSLGVKISFACLLSITLWSVGSKNEKQNIFWLG